METGDRKVNERIDGMNEAISAIEDETWRKAMSVMEPEVEHAETLFWLDRETKNAIRYEEVVKPGVEASIKTIYVKKWAMPKDRKWPSHLYVHIRFED